MKSDYERSRFIRKYWLIAVPIILVLSILATILFGMSLKALLFPLLFLIPTLVLFFVCYREIDKTYSDVEEIAGRMNMLLENEENMIPGELREGSVGILYTNFDKMVQMFREGKAREQKEKEFLKDMISDISHQLKTPLSSLMVFIDLLTDDKLPPEEQKKILKEAESQLDRMEWLVLSMLKQARIEAGVIDFQLQEVALSSVLVQVREGVEYLLNERDQTILIDCTDHIKALCEPEWLTEALINLVKNASDYSGEGKRIWITCTENSLYTRLSVKDEGIGIEEKDLHHIFARFYRANHEVNPNSVGIGLSLARSIIEGMSGTISVASEPGKGTEFIIILPSAALRRKETSLQTSSEGK